MRYYTVNSSPHQLDPKDETELGPDQISSDAIELKLLNISCHCSTQKSQSILFSQLYFKFPTGFGLHLHQGWLGLPQSFINY